MSLGPVWPYVYTVYVIIHIYVCVCLSIRLTSWQLILTSTNLNDFLIWTNFHMLFSWLKSVCVCVCLMVLLFCSSWSLWQKLHLPLQHLWVLYNDIVSSNMLKYIFWYYKRADNDLIERITLPWEHTEKIASWLSQTTVCRVHCWRNGTMVCHNHENRRFESYLKYISCWASCITVLLRRMHSIATIWKRNIRHSLYMFVILVLDVISHIMHCSQMPFTHFSSCQIVIGCQ